VYKGTQTIKTVIKIRIPQQRDNKERELNMYTNIKISNRKKLQLKILVDLGCTHIGIGKQLVKKERIKTEPMNKSFKVFNADRTKNGEVTRFALLELETNGHIENTVVIDLNSMNMFLGYDWLVKHNLEVNWDKGTIQFTRCLRECKT